MIKDFLHNFIGFCLSLLPPNVGILSGIIAAVLTDPFEALRLLSGRSAYTPDTYKSYPNAITQLHSVLINDSHHSVLIRGCDASKPVLLILHGGPGATDIPFHRSYGQYLELDFVVVHYDQRGACKSAVLNSSLKNFAETITVEQHINDAIGVATWIIQNPLLPDAKNGIFLLGG